MSQEREVKKMTKMIAAVATVGEALLAVHEGADLIDLLDPAHGTLGALDPEICRSVATIVDGRKPLSCCIGNYPEILTDEMVAEVRRRAALEVDFLRIGFSGTREDAACVRALAPFSALTRLVGVVFADRTNSLHLLDAFAEWGFSAAILDTARKDGPALRDLKTDMDLALFVRRARRNGLLVGLSGNLAVDDVAPLLTLEPDYLYFRSALCVHRYRNGFIDPPQFRLIRNAIPAEQEWSSANRVRNGGRTKIAP
jgi:dihydroneopterin aldolase